MSYDLSFLGEPKYGGPCRYQDCDRKFGPYYSELMLKDAQRAHDAAQHANELPAMRQSERGDGKMARSTKPNPPYLPPTIHARSGYAS